MYLKRDVEVIEAPSFAIASRRKKERRTKRETEEIRRRGVSFGKFLSILTILQRLEYSK
jgi:hypothetical protein